MGFNKIKNMETNLKHLLTIQNGLNLKDKSSPLFLRWYHLEIYYLKHSAECVFYTSVILLKSLAQLELPK